MRVLITVIIWWTLLNTISCNWVTKVWRRACKNTSFSEGIAIVQGGWTCLNTFKSSRICEISSCADGNTVVDHRVKKSTTIYRAYCFTVCLFFIAVIVALHAGSIRNIIAPFTVQTVLVSCQ